MSKTNDFNVVFTSAINEGLTAARAIADTSKKAEVFAQLAQAIAQTGLVTASEGTTDTAAEPEAPKAEAPKKSPKADAKKALTPKPDKTVEKKEEPKAEAKDAKEPEWTTEWTDEAMVAFDKELDTLAEKVEEYGEELNAVVAEFSEGKYNNPDDLNPLNIRAFLVYLSDLEKSLEEEETAG